jgi:hypothetical protein
MTQPDYDNDLVEKAKQINERVGLRADGRISVWCAGAWETSRLLAGLLSRIEDLERHLDKQDQSIEDQNKSSQSPCSHHMADLIMAFSESVKGTFLEEDRSSNLPSENCVSTDYRSLCIRLLNALDSGNAKAEDHVLCQIRQAVKDEENRAMTLATK